LTAMAVIAAALAIVVTPARIETAPVGKRGLL
jgi:hypothetical protein